MTKFFNNYLFLLCVAFGALFFSSCSKDDDAENDNGVVINPDKNIPDPKGTITMNMMVGDGDDKRVTINDFGKIQINSAYNFVGYDYDYSFVSLGKMKGLGNVTAIPQYGWNRSVAVNPGDGYVVRCKEYYGSTQYIYARLYVVSEIAGTSGGIIGYTIKCQAPFVFAPKFTESSLEFDADENLTKELTFVNPTNVTVKSKPDWCEVKAADKGFKVTATPNYINAERSGIIEFENTEGSTSVSVKQKKSDNPKFEAGNGTETDPYIIATAAQLDEVRNFPSACFELSKDIDLSYYLNSNSSGWTPIKDFTGKFDGKKHTIKGLWISLSSISNVGLFANIQGSSDNKRASVSNLFVNISKKGITGGSCVGGICGYSSYGNIENCMVTGDISGSGKVGGIVGYDSYYSSIISQCASSGNIIANHGSVGGILGSYYESCSIENCYSIANVKTEYSSTVYGIGGSAENCYFAGTISGTDVNRVYPIAYSYSNSYYDSEKTKISGKPGALTTKEMKQQASFQGWDFDKIWTIQEGVDYPKLRSLQK
ncbi:GLUG motif-containing protein [Leyella stercorea]|uniref:GLUG motif-containing protein n=1 Tax=Leyella stercorea TaxID=363265 RepID=UPI00242E45DE|nr:GLUG motif-containing protein [Leyella stercorea]